MQSLRTMLGIAGLLLITSPLYAQIPEQATRIDVLVPQSSIEKPEDIGVRAHTHLFLLNPASEIHPAGGLGPGGGMTPAQIRSFYHLPSSGGGQIIAIVDAYHDATALNDFNYFANYYGLPQETSSHVLSNSNKVFQMVYASGSQPPQDSTGSWELEESMDIEWAHAMAPGAKIVLVEANSNLFSDLLPAVSVATSFTDSNGLQTKEVSMSWYSSEFSGETSDDSYFTSGSVVYFACTGDNGAPGGWPATSPYVIAAGGTTVTTDSNGKFVSESGWANGGGGPSTYESRPSFQNAIQYLVASSRGIPDISDNSSTDSPDSIYDTTPYDGYTGWLVAWGTSLASPGLAGMLNLADSNAGAWADGSQAELAIIYSNLGIANFRDITSGNNGYPCKIGR